MTYNQLVTAFHNFAISHKQLNTFHCGDLSHFQTKENLYPAMIVMPKPSQIGQSSVSVSFNVYFADLLNRDITNLNEVHSDMLDVCIDFFKYLENSSEDYIISNDTKTLQPFSETLTDIVAGWQGSFTIEWPIRGHCDIPWTTEI